MNIPEWVKPGVYGAIVGAVAITVVGFSWGGWMTGGDADKMASEMSREDVTAALVPMCMDNSHADLGRIAKLAGIEEAASYKRRDAVMDTGWATIPGSDAPNRDLAAACLTALQAEAA